MNKQILRLWILERLEKLAATASELEMRIDHALHLTSEDYDNATDKIHQVIGQQTVLKEIYSDFNLEPDTDEELQFH
jgi:hypothetical protein